MIKEINGLKTAENLFTFRKDAANPDQYVITATTSAIDRDGEIVEPTGLTNLQDYLKNNPVILYAHDWQGLPIGKAVAGAILENRIELTIEFAKTDIGKEVKYLYDNGFLNAFSVGFKILADGYKQEARDGRMIGVISKWELYEVSAVPIPANQFALIQRGAEADGVSLKSINAIIQKSDSKQDATQANAENVAASAAKYAGLVDQYNENQRRSTWTRLSS